MYYRTTRSDDHVQREMQEVSRQLRPVPQGQASVQGQADAEGRVDARHAPERSKERHRSSHNSTAASRTKKRKRKDASEDDSNDSEESEADEDSDDEASTPPRRRLRPHATDDTEDSRRGRNKKAKNKKKKKKKRCDERSEQKVKKKKKKKKEAESNDDDEEEEEEGANATTKNKNKQKYTLQQQQGMARTIVGICAPQLDALDHIVTDKLSKASLKRKVSSDMNEQAEKLLKALKNVDENWKKARRSTNVSQKMMNNAEKDKATVTRLACSLCAAFCFKRSEAKLPAMRFLGSRELVACDVIAFAPA